MVMLGKLKDLYLQQRARMEATKERLDIYRDDWVYLLDNAISPRVKKETMQKLKHYLSIIENPFKQTVNQLSDAYKLNPKRIFSDMPEVLVNEYSEWYEKNRINEFMQNAQRLLNATNDILIYLQFVDGDIQPSILTGNVVMVSGSTQAPTIPEAIFIKKLYDENDTDTEANTYWVVWTESEHFKIGHNGTHVAIDGNEGMVNPWGFMPFVYLHKNLPIDNFFDETTGNDLVNCTVSIGIRETMTEFARFYSGFKQAAITGDFEDPPPGIMLNPDSLFTVHGTDVELKVLDWQIDLAALEEDIRATKERVQQNYGINTDKGDARQESSGVALAIRNQRLMEFRQEQIKIFSQAERELFQILMRMDSISKSRSPIENAEMSIIFPEPDIYTPPEIDLANHITEIKSGLASIVDVYMERKQIADRRQAIDDLKRIQEENDMFPADGGILRELNRESPDSEEIE